MRNILLAFQLLFFCSVVAAQEQQPRIFAVVTGISEYANKGIPALRFANRDAEAFANYLRSSDGGNVKEEHMRLLMNEKATTAAVYDALNWLIDEVKENDVVYFYFAGHGDMESSTMYKLGFLLTYNTPRTNYINNAVRIEDLNRFANTLSVKNKAQVILITDACHSGTLAGKDFRGNFLAAEQLRIVQKNEIRIASCGPDQLAMEDEAWGGGRGVFSFYLINGLIGFAAREPDGVVRLKDIRTYLDSSFANDSLLLREKHVQNPVVKGADQFKLSVKNETVMTALQQQQMHVVVMQTPVVQNELELPPNVLMDHVTEWMKETRLDSAIDFKQLEKLPAEKIAIGFLHMYRQYLEKDSQAADNRIQIIVKEVLQLQQWIEQDSISHQQFNSRLVVFLHDLAQDVINKYLEGDAAELERRRYYNAKSNAYDVYPLMYAVALKLTPADHYLYHILAVNRYYFAAVSLLLKIPLTGKPAPLIDQAYTFVTKALALEENAPYIYNTLGVLYLYKNNFKAAETNFLKATELAPQWAIPWSNLLSLYTAQKNYKAATDAFAKAKQLGSENSDVYANAGWLYEEQRNFLFAEEMQRKSIFYNSRHYYPFERLASIYNRTTSYAVADSFYFEADVRKRGFFFNYPTYGVVDAPRFIRLPKPIVCPFDSSIVDKDDLAGYYAWGRYYFDNWMYADAIKKWKHVIELNKKDPIIYHHLGKAFFALKNWASADVMFNLANHYYISKEQFESYSDSIMAQSVAGFDTSCMYGTYKFAHYTQSFNDQLMASMYDQWNHYTEAEFYYRKLIAANPANFIHNKRFWLMLARIGRYYEEEEAIKLFSQHAEPGIGNNELFAFYQRMESQFPYNADWHLKAGSFLYKLVKENAINYETDRKAIFPDALKPLSVILITHGVEAEEPEGFMEVNRRVHLEYALPVQAPLTNAIHSLLAADSLIALNDSLSADIHDKVGDLYRWQGVPLYAATHYRKSVQLLPANTGVRLKLIDADDETYQFTDALESLDTLNSRNEINYDKMVLLAKYYLHMSKFNEAEIVLKKAIAVHPHKMPVLYELHARLYLLQGKHEEAIKRYNEYLQLVPNDAAAMYSISRMYVQLKEKNKAFEWLKKSFANGFNYGWVLNEDPLMNNLRGTAQWKKLLSKQRFIKYPEPTNSYPHEEVTE